MTDLKPDELEALEHDLKQVRAFVSDYTNHEQWQRWNRVEARLRSAEAESDRRGKALEEAEKTFRWYGDLHASKPDEAKARRNYELADAMAAALQPKTGEDA